MDRKTQTSVRIAAITVIVLASLLSAHADTYRISEIRGGSHSIDGVELHAGSTVSDLSRIVSRWDEDRGQSRYIKLYNLTTRRTQIIPAPVTKKSERGFWDKVVSYFSEIRKCSTRAPENELTGGLGESLSRTFYVMAGDADTDITIASRLPVDDTRRLEASFSTPSGIRRASFERRGAAVVLPASVFAGIESGAPRTQLIVTVDYIDRTTGRRLTLSDSMTVIIISE